MIRLQRIYNFDYSMLLHYLFWIFFICINMLFYIIFWTNLLTQSLVPVPVFSLFLSFTEKEYQAESKWNKIFAMIFLDQKV